MIESKKSMKFLSENKETKKDGHFISLYWADNCWHTYGTSAYLLHLLTVNITSKKMVYVSTKKKLPIAYISNKELQMLIKKKKVQTIASTTMKIFVPNSELPSGKCYSEWVDQIEDKKVFLK